MIKYAVVLRNIDCSSSYGCGIEESIDGNMVELSDVVAELEAMIVEDQTMPRYTAEKLREAISRITGEE